MVDTIIVGGGLTGGTLACALAEKGLEIAIIDQIDPHKSLISDGRSFALSRSSYNVFSKLGMWPSKVTPITSIYTSDGILPQWVEYHEKDVGGGPLGYVVDSAHLKTKILKKVLACKNIRLYAPTSIARLERTGGYTQIETLEGDRVQAPLCIAADGKFSTLRQWAKIPLIHWSYNQVAIVCNMAHTLPHENWAFEHFIPSGPLAFVPRLGNESGLVWSIEKDKADILLNLSEEEFAEEVQAIFGPSLGVLTLSSQRWSYPLNVCLPRRLIDNRLALVGDAAHIFHPVAGQGLNVGLRDVAALAEVLSDAFSLGLDLGSSTILKRYQKARRTDIIGMTLLTDGLVRVFSNQSRLLAHARSVGFGLTRRCPFLKNFMIRHAMGITGKVPYLARD
ncbi:MAG: UbiH/UbiF/VisC/COQ6 family ubiquinone biosynthesis hydroxylase [Alphaproteobacteria bacterium]|nr:UbiH/UbiF/VisC/COQ6 family ubiquinone biosynthesis hydroxylase [Alphaproteobacteria bacterium]